MERSNEMIFSNPPKLEFWRNFAILQWINSEILGLEWINTETTESTLLEKFFEKFSGRLNEKFH